ncbi:hypothetical protein [Gramella sp. KN1008]|uniref:hypothetical protein n=1 Tax=Gramella sp. KN1008 TaxID=2529298 RepID=UPI00103E5196|nr:hypothetical protein [Gramella sp. KN1008]TBW27611.1 hypothetical protein EZJ28_11610 [Gramella sp. KN1008]
MYKSYFSWILVILPLISLGQSEIWNKPVNVINEGKINIERVVYYQSDGFALDKDSLAISNNLKFEDIIITLYHDEISMEPDVDYYVVGMDIPIMELIELEDRERGITLIFSRKCKPNPNDEKQRLELNLANQEAKEDLYLAFEKILKIRDSQHQNLHELNQCNIGADY